MEEKNPETTDTPNDLQETKEAFDQAQMADISQEQPVEIDNQKMSETVEQKEAVEPEKEAIESSSPTTQHQVSSFKNHCNPKVVILGDLLNSK